MDKVRSTLRQFVRDWSVSGEGERKAAYGPILDAINQAFPGVPIHERGAIKVLVPGAGLGRLAFEIVRRGYSCQGNEFSMFMLLASNFILNTPESVDQFTIFPWIHLHSNVLTQEQQLRAETIPDVLIRDCIPPTAEFSMVAGDFINIYGGAAEEGSWDAIVTCFFIDTAKNVCKYLDVIRHALRPGGLWINLGPLLYHFEGDEDAVEFTLDEVMALVAEHGFEVRERRMVQTTYTAPQTTMLESVYNCAFWVAHVPPGGNHE
ncbi:hypothetical protein HK105_204370 [Polyrhizophydium stewartii]|uniref:carnosine N-methyltransferase n=1 Tax=Polyrhizophydium stewartii TaxID=2732419 RepID=A0ABR4N8V6_9FUNG|nr:hypothetical protein HK105_001162 [Polyrhizophydium stewartii]